MKKRMNRGLAVLLVVIMLLCAAPLEGFVGMELFGSKSNAAGATTGQCGDNVYWSYNVGTAALTISGEGDMKSYSVSFLDMLQVTEAPWRQYYNQMKTVEIKDSVTGIGNGAFYGCLRLTSVSIGSSVTNIGWNAFKDCYNLIRITVDKNNNYYSSDENGVLYNKDKTVLLQYPHGKGNTFLMPDSVTNIGDYAFDDCRSLNGVVISDRVTSIGDYAFRYCSGLTNVTIPNIVTSIGRGAFEGCYGLTRIAIPDSVTSIVYDAFSGCPLEYVKMGSGLKTIPSSLIQSTLKEFVIGDSVTNIDSSAFNVCSNLTSVSIGNSVTSIGSAFYNCSSLTSVSIGNSVTSIGNSAFSGCSSLKSITIPDSVTSIGNYAFNNCSSLKNITIPDSITSIAYNAFSGCPLEYVEMGSGLKTIPSSLIQSTLKEFVIGDSVTSIVNYAFENCSRLTRITIPDSVTSIGTGSFSGCNSLVSITISDSVKSIGNHAIGYFWDTSVNDYSKINNLVISGYSGTAAETYAKENGFKFIDMTEPEHIHTHSFTNYVSDGNATCTTDGTKTAVCDNGCGETNTIADEGSIKSHDDNNHDGKCDNCGFDFTEDCTCKCHKDRPGFFWKLQMFFWKLFKIKSHQYCACGKAHW